MKILVVDHGHSTRCGIRDLGVRIADRLDAVHVDVNNLVDYCLACAIYEPQAVIVNYRTDLLPWWRPTQFSELAVLHNYGPTTVDARAAELLAAGFDHVLVLDPTVQPSDSRVHAVGRPLPPAPSLFAAEPPDHPRIGSFGFAFPHKGFADVAAEVATIPDAVYALHMPEAHFNGVGGAPLYTEGILNDINGRLDGHTLDHTAEELTPGALVDRLAGNMVNCLLYAPGQPDAGLSSALDYLIAAGRPMLLSDADMFVVAEGQATWPEFRLAEVVDDLGFWQDQADDLLDIATGEFESAVAKVLESL